MNARDFKKDGGICRCRRRQQDWPQQGIMEGQVGPPRLKEPFFALDPTPSGVSISRSTWSAQRAVSHRSFAYMGSCALRTWSKHYEY